MNKNVKNAQDGFTLIELIVVIVVLGILAATALPKFTSLGGDARLASLEAAKGALNSTAAMAHGKFVINPSATAPNGMSFAGSSGYPVADTTLATAAGLTASDYVIVPAGTPIPDGTTPGTNVAADTVMIVPKSLSGTAGAATCNLTYNISATAAASTEPVVTLTGTADACK